MNSMLLVVELILSIFLSQMVALNRVQKQISAMIGVVISEATLLKFVWRLYQALERWEVKSIEDILQAPSIHVDETSFRVDRKNHWIHVYSSGGTTLKLLHRKRGKEAIVDLNIIPRYGGVIIHDCWASYLSYDHCGHGLCGSHLLRELTFIVESNQYRWAANMKKLLQETCHKRSSDGKGKTENIRLFSMSAICSCLLSNFKLPANHGKQRRESSCCHSACFVRAITIIHGQRFMVNKGFPGGQESPILTDNFFSFL